MEFRAKVLQGDEVILDGVDVWLNVTQGPSLKSWDGHFDLDKSTRNWMSGNYRIVLEDGRSGEFFVKGQISWAVLCSTGGQSGILVFRNDSDTKPDELARAEDRNYLQGDVGGVIVYSREVSVVERQYIVRHYRAYGGPEPPPIDHQGINDSFLEKASVVHYWYQGRWLQLTGAD